MTKIYRFDFAGGGYVTSEDMDFAEDFAKLVEQYGLPTNIELATGYTYELVRAAVKWVNSQGGSIAASGTGGIEWTDGDRLNKEG